MKCKLAALLFAVGLVGGCAPRALPAFANEVPNVGKIEKFFIVFVQDDGTKPGGCKVDVYPKGPSATDPDSVKVKNGWQVAWFVVNTCAAQAGVTPTLEFEIKGDPTKKKKPVNYSHQTADFLIGKIKNARDCKDMTEEAPCTPLKYTIRFNAAYEDPDIEIVM